MVAPSQVTLRNRRDVVSIVVTIASRAVRRGGLGRVSGRERGAVRHLQVERDGWPGPIDDVLRERAEERRPADREHDEQRETATPLAQERDDDGDGERDHDGAAPQPRNHAHHVGPGRGAVLHEPPRDRGVECGRADR